MYKENENNTQIIGIQNAKRTDNWLTCEKPFFFRFLVQTESTSTVHRAKAKKNRIPRGIFNFPNGKLSPLIIIFEKFVGRNTG